MIRIGVDLGGTKMEIAALDESGAELLRRRASAPRGSYAEAIEAIAQFVLEAEREAGAHGTVGIGTPGAVSRGSGVLKNAYASALNGKPVKPDLERRLDRDEERLARALASVINLLDPEVIVLGGGLSRIERLVRNVPARWTRHVYSDSVVTRLVKAAHGDASGVRGAARQWCPAPRRA